MARRKQRKPQHLENERDLAQSLQNGIGSGSDTEEDEHVCGKCRAEFPSLSTFLEHKKLCVSKRPVLVHPPEDSSMDSDDDEEGDENSDRLSPQELDRSLLSQQTNNSFLMANLNPLLMLIQQQNRTDNIFLEELKNTSVAVAQHSNPADGIREFLSKFRKTQVENLQIIRSLEHIVLQNLFAAAGPTALNGAAAALTPLQNTEGPSVASSAPSSTNLAEYPQGSRTEEDLPVPVPENTIALLEKHTERYLQDSMRGPTFMLNGIDDDKSKRSKTDDPSSRHKCLYCGKLLGSDSALQIHIRSHTGEKPFTCEVCKSSFSTRGNLKVHFQRHRENPEELLALSATMTDAQKKAQELRNGERRPDNPPLLYPNDTNHRGESSKVDQALDFSTSVNGRKSPNEDNSRSVSPNDMSNFSDNSDGSSDENMTAENFSELKIDVERYDDDDRDNSNMDDDESEAAAPSQTPFGTSPNFSSYFQPSSYDGFPVPSTSQPGPSTSNVVCAVGGPSNNEGSDSILQDPTYYQDLLPRIGSNDNSWESLIEITKTSETHKLQQLVDNIEHKLIEPNQCIICHRVLSCKSALQMHYRTHTGERPFKCKLCSRAFTTKGNLKTHMGVHRTKPATRLMHQCPVCHKPYPNALLLQQHIRSHTENPNLQLAPLYASCEDRPPTLMPSYPRQFLMPPQLMNAEPLALTSNKPQEKSTSTNESVIKSANLETNMSLNQCSSPALSSAGSCSPPCNTDENVNKELQPPVLDLAQPDQDDMNEEKMSHSPSDIPKITDDNDDSNDRGTLADRSSPGEDQNDFDTKVKQELPNLTHSPKSFIGSQENENISPSNFSVKSPPKYSPSETTLVSLASDRPLPMTLPSDIPLPFSMHNSDRPYPPMSVPDFTTASLTALENHVKGISSNVSHPLPFPPFGLSLSVPNFYRDYNYQQHKSNSSPSASKNGSDGSADDRSTPGSAAAPSSKGESPRASAMITHSTPKSESSNGIGALDLTPRNSPGFHRPAGTEIKIYAPLAGLPFVPPQHRMGTTCRICFKTFACQSALEIHYRSHTKERPFRCEVCDRGFSTKGNMRQHMLTHKIRDLPAQVFTKSSNNNSNSNSSMSNNINNNSNNNSSTPPNPPNPPNPPPPKIEPVEEKSPKKPPEEVAKRSPTDISLPQPKRPPGQPKHLCQVCTKPFSSGSALQIHMRTHTGDKPFQCHICHRAFTTKGNLKVHMGTHMWNNSTSRRGRRMSLDISPLQLTAPGAKPGEPFTQASYFPYLTPFLNGLPPPPQPQPKMNEISVIQTAGVSNGAIVTAPPATTSSSAPSMPQQPLPLLSTSKREEQIPSQNQNYLPGHC